MRLFILPVLLMLGCQSKNSRDEVPARSTSGASSGVERHFSDYKLENGIEGLIVADPVLPKVHFTVLIQAGSKDDPEEKLGLAQLTASLMEAGSGSLRAFEIAEKFEFLGSELSIHASKDRIVFSVDGLALYRDQLLTLLYSVLTEPRFDDSEFNRIQSEMVSQIQKLPEQPTSFAAQVFDHLIYQGSVYGHPPDGTISGLQKIKLADVRQFYKTHVQPCHVKLDISGAVDEEFLARTKAKWNGWRATCTPNRAVETNWKPVTRKIVLVNTPGQQQTQIRFGHFGISASSPDHLAATLVNAILGQGFSSRLNQHVRDDLGLTYSISSTFAMARDRGLFSVMTFTRPEKTAEALREAEKVIADYAVHGPTAKELESAKTLLIAQFPAGLQTASQFADELRGVREEGLADVDLLNFQAKVRAVTLSEVREAAAKHIFPGQMLFTVISDPAQVLTQLQSLLTAPGASVEVIDAKNVFR